jgi:hypothetical protein
MTNLDLFGHTISLNDGVNAGTHKTFVGGVVSLFLEIVIGAFFVTKMIRLLTLTDPDTSAYLAV